MVISFLVNLFVIGFSLILGFGSAVNSPADFLVKPQKIENKGIYLTAYIAGMKQRREELVDLINQTELNSVVIDVKDYSGMIFFDTNLAEVDKIGAEDIRISDLKNWLKYLKQQGIYTIARITVFQDPYLAENKPEIALKSKSGGIWRDKKGLAWVDPTQRYVWEYNINLAKETAKLGFDEINFDYIRFPSDGDIKQIVYANLDKNGDKSKVMADFYQYLDQSLTFYPVLTSGDMFGMVLWRNDGLNIGQRFEDAAPHFDYICPMVYPSHYPPGFKDFANPADHPYEIVFQSLDRVKNAKYRAKVRPWLQAFDMGAVYDDQKIRLQKKATYDSGGYGWLLWNASNRYTNKGLDKN
ncbi:MAG: putative glycoside hydrolase [Candidatus Buchananbacteria bacterium]